MISKLKHLLISLHLLLTGLLNPVLSDELPGLVWLPSESYFETLILDPSAPQTSASMLSYNVDGSSEEKLYSPINIGVRKIAVRYIMGLQNLTSLAFEPDLRPRDQRIIESANLILDYLT